MIKKFSLILLVIATPLIAAPNIQVGFSPGDAENLVVRNIEQAKSTIDIAAYSFTSKPIALALVRAEQQGVKIQVVADKKANSHKYTVVHYLSQHGIPVRLDAHYAIMHNKFMVIDGVTVETGSFNYTKAAALHNAENVIVVGQDPSVAQQYMTEFHRLWDESRPL